MLCRLRDTSSWAIPSHWSARGPCSAILPGSGPRPGRGWPGSSSSGLSRVPGTVASSWSGAWVMRGGSADLSVQRTCLLVFGGPGAAGWQAVGHAGAGKIRTRVCLLGGFPPQRLPFLVGHDPLAMGLGSRPTRLGSIRAALPPPRGTWTGGRRPGYPRRASLPGPSLGPQTGRFRRSLDRGQTLLPGQKFQSHPPGVPPGRLIEQGPGNLNRLARSHVMTHPLDRHSTGGMRGVGVAADCCTDSSPGTRLRHTPGPGYPD
jgi:hypothetical protein